MIRGQGLAKKLALMALDHAREQGLNAIWKQRLLREAIALYERLGFEHISEPLGCTGHVDCEISEKGMLKDALKTGRLFILARYYFC